MKTKTSNSFNAISAVAVSSALVECGGGGSSLGQTTARIGGHLKTKSKIALICACAWSASIVVGCGGGGGSSSSSTTAAPTNVAPVANAGAAQSVAQGTKVTLSGSSSSDSNGDALTYAWTLSTKPAGSTSTLVSSTSVSPTFTPDLPGTYIASLVVSDGKATSGTATVTVTSSATSVSVTVGSKTLSLPLPTLISSAADSNPSGFTTDDQISLWSVVAGLSAYSVKTQVPLTVSTLRAVAWPITYPYWQRSTIVNQVQQITTGIGCKIDLVGNSLVMTVNGATISATIDGLPDPSGLPAGSTNYDYAAIFASQNTSSGTATTTRNLEISAVDYRNGSDFTQVNITIGFSLEALFPGGAAGGGTPLDSYRCSNR